MGHSKLLELAESARSCTACDLYKNATQTVFGEGPERARLVLVGEQPGDQEDREGRPFVGPAGLVLDRALAEAGISRDEVYVTNAVKHFKWEPRGKRRLHSKPNMMEVHACHGWLEAEIAAVKPAVIVCMGSTAVQAVLGRALPIKESRGEIFEALGARVVVTVHPSALLRLRSYDEHAYERGKRELADDLRFALSETRPVALPTATSPEPRARPDRTARPRSQRPASGGRSTYTRRAAAARRASTGPVRPPRGPS
jgi:DNA polymerase